METKLPPPAPRVRSHFPMPHTEGAKGRCPRVSEEGGVEDWFLHGFPALLGMVRSSSRVFVALATRGSGIGLASECQTVRKPDTLPEIPRFSNTYVSGIFIVEYCFTSKVKTEFPNYCCTASLFLENYLNLGVTVGMVLKT